MRNGLAAVGMVLWLVSSCGGSDGLAAVGMVLWLVSSCGGSGGSGTNDGGSGGASNVGGSTGSGGSTGGGSGGSGSPGSTSGVTGSKALSTLTTTEKGKYCDWDASLWGGYNQTKTCPPDSAATNAMDQADCLADFPSCAATVTQFEACSKKIASNPCDLLGAFTSAECAPLASCL